MQKGTENFMAHIYGEYEDFLYFLHPSTLVRLWTVSTLALLIFLFLCAYICIDRTPLILC